MFGNGRQLVRIETKIDNATKGVHERLDRHEDKQDRWQEKMNKKLGECPESEKIGGIRDDVDILNSDKIKREGKFLGVKLVYAVIIGALGFIAIVLGILWRLGLL